jgi:hypothetical protein
MGKVATVNHAEGLDYGAPESVALAGFSTSSETPRKPPMAVNTRSMFINVWTWQQLNKERHRVSAE